MALLQGQQDDYDQLDAASTDGDWGGSDGTRVVGGIDLEGRPASLRTEERTRYRGLILAGMERAAQAFRSRFFQIVGGRAEADGEIDSTEIAPDGTAQRLLVDGHGRIFVREGPPIVGPAATLFSAVVPGGVGGVGVYTTGLVVTAVREIAFYVQWTPPATGGPLSIRFEASPEPSGVTAFHAVPIRSTFTQPATVGSVAAGATPPGQITLAQGQSAFLDVENLQLPRGPITFGQTYTRYLPVAVAGMHQIRLNLFDTGVAPFTGTAIVRYVTVA